MKEFDDLVQVMIRLRSPDGCPWDREQTHESIRKYLIEEAYEVTDAIDRGDPAELCLELGDLLLQVVFHARISADGGGFGVEDVCNAITRKLERRHPHVFGDVAAETPEQVARNWEAIKAAERGPGASLVDGVPRALPALQRAERISEKASRSGFDWEDAQAVAAKLDEERAELAEALEAQSPQEIFEEIGDLLFTAANLARKLDLDPELALRAATDRFEGRFRHVEAAAAGAGEKLEDLSAAELQRRWDQAKAALRPSAAAGD